ncbi:MAG: preprotein translocase subunit SecA [Rickettsiaceae bacterium H1]|nr:preprotein translocase subunit SecA [Rickettsiaceae bacterium H1]
MLSVIQKLFSSANEREVNSLKKVVVEIVTCQKLLKKLSDKDLGLKTQEFKSRLIKNECTIDDLLPQAFAVVREMSKRVLGMEHFEVQLLGGIVLHKGMIAEMKTGEGKTLVATLPAYLNALLGKGVHIVTVNDYLARRDSEWMGKLYESLRMSVSCITSNISDEERQAAYKADITYGTNNEFGFDYLRDNMKFSREHMVQRELNYAIVDEVDSILIDEARTPLIISGPVKQDKTLYERINKLIPLLSDDDILLEEKQRSAVLTEEGTEKVEDLLKQYSLISNETSLYDIENIDLVHHVDQAVRAHKLFSRDKDYIVKDGKVVIIDEFTGRMMEGRRYSDGLHQALEAKEEVNIQQENQTLASTTFQNYFRLYKKLAGMTGTAITETDEFASIYSLKVIAVPTNLPVNRKDHDDEIYCTEAEKLDAIIKLIKECNERDQPVLVGTVSIAKSELLAKELKKHKLQHSILNARYHEREASIIAQAGQPGAITIATNMAGRGTDIKLGGNPDVLSANDENINEAIEKKKQRVIKAGGLYIIGTERHESRRIDNQLRGRSGRQGDPGESKFFLSLQDDLLRIFGSDNISGILKKLGMKNGEAVYHPLITRALEKAQKKVEARNCEIRKNLLRFDDPINQQRQVIFSKRNEIIDSVDYNLSELRKSINKKIVLSSVINKEEIDTKRIANEIIRIYGVNLQLDDFEQDEIERLIEDATRELFENKEELYQDSIIAIKKHIMLITLDSLWKEHLLVLDRLKQGIGLRAIGHKNPINEFKKEAFFTFQSMMEQWDELIISRFAKFVATVKRDFQRKVSRNDPCPCGSGKKYKHCHGKVT